MDTSRFNLTTQSCMKVPNVFKSTKKTMYLWNVAYQSNLLSIGPTLPDYNTNQILALFQRISADMLKTDHFVSKEILAKTGIKDNPYIKVTWCLSVYLYQRILLTFTMKLLIDPGNHQPPPIWSYFRKTRIESGWVLPPSPGPLRSVAACH